MRTIQVTYHAEQGEWWAESPDVQGFSAAEHGLENLRALVSSGLRFFLGEDVAVLERLDNGTLLTPSARFLGPNQLWVATSAAMSGVGVSQPSQKRTSSSSQVHGSQARLAVPA